MALSVRQKIVGHIAFTFISVAIALGIFWLSGVPFVRSEGMASAVAMGLIMGISIGGTIWFFDDEVMQ